jgi:hypothetical protein
MANSEVCDCAAIATLLPSDRELFGAVPYLPRRAFMLHNFLSPALKPAFTGEGLNGNIRWFLLIHHFREDCRLFLCAETRHTSDFVAPQCSSGGAR